MESHFLSSSFQLHILKTVNSSLIYMKTDCGTDYVESLNSGCTGIYHQHIPFIITHYLENMGMPTYENIRMEFVDQPACRRVIAARIATYMSHKHLHAFTFEEPVKRMGVAQIIIVTITSHAKEGLESGNIFSQIHSSPKITCVPYLIHFSKEVSEFFTEHSMSI